MMIASGTLNNSSIKQLTAVVYGLENELLEEAELGKLPKKTPLFDFQPAYDQKSTERLKLTRREQIIDLALGDLLHIEREITDEKKVYEDLRLDFEDRYNRLKGVASKRSLVAVRETIQAMQPKQAADQIIRLMDSSNTTTDPPMEFDAITIVKTMPVNLRKKILAEFKDDNQVYLERIISQIQSGVPEIPLIRQTRTELSQLDLRFKSGEASDPAAN